jgi:hypothetical protein
VALAPTGGRRVVRPFVRARSVAPLPHGGRADRSAGGGLGIRPTGFDPALRAPPSVPAPSSAAPAVGAGTTTTPHAGDEAGAPRPATRWELAMIVGVLVAGTLAAVGARALSLAAIRRRRRPHRGPRCP